MRGPWKQIGLGFLNLAAVVCAIAVMQTILHKRLPLNVGMPIIATVTLLAYIAGCKWIERRIPTELDVRRALPETSAGLAAGVFLFAAVMATLWALGVYRPATGTLSSTIASGLLAAVVAGVFEEILFRGLLFRILSVLFGTWGALLLTAALFGAAHAGNPGATFTSSLAVALEAGILLGAAYAATTRLWLPIGLHIGWNFTEGSIFGMSVSGNVATGGLLGGSLSGARLLTGGPFGPEASLVAVLLCLALGIYFLARTVQLGRVQPPLWRRSGERSMPAAIQS